MTKEVVQQKIEKMKESLLVKKKETSRYNRTLTSASDPRQSAKNLGLVGVTVICVVVAVIILPDYINLYRKCQSKTKRHRDQLYPVSQKGVYNLRFLRPLFCPKQIYLSYFSQKLLHEDNHLMFGVQAQVLESHCAYLFHSCTTSTCCFFCNIYGQT